MDWKWMPVVTGVFLAMALLAGGASVAGAEESATGVFEPVDDVEGYDTIFEDQGGTAKDVFGPVRGHVHPFLSLSGFYTSNLFRTDENEDEATAVVISPGIWLALPASRQRMVDIETLNTSPGGLEVSRFRTSAQRRFQGYALYRFDRTEYSNVDLDAAPDTTDRQRAEAMLQYNFRGGLSVELLNVFEDDHDTYSTGDAEAGELDTFKANRLNPSIGYQMSPKTRFEVEYAWYVLDYDPERRSFRDREDHVFSGTAFYKFTPKTSTFVDYEYILVDHDESARRDSDEQRIFVGIQRRVTDKSRARIKLGYGKRDFDNSDEDHGFFAAEAQLIHRFNRKSSVRLIASRSANQPDIEGVDYVLVERLRLGYNHRLTAKVTGKVMSFYYRKEYNGIVTTGDQTGERTDDKYGAELALGYSPTRWLNLSSGYAYTERDSNFNTRDYRDHTLFLNVTTAL